MNRSWVDLRLRCFCSERGGVGRAGEGRGGDGRDGEGSGGKLSVLNSRNPSRLYLLLLLGKSSRRGVAIASRVLRRGVFWKQVAKPIRWQAVSLR